MWALFRLALQAAFYGASGWVASDIYNESQRTSQINAGKTPTQDTSTSGSVFTTLQEITGLPRWILWLVFLVAIAYAIRNLFRRK